MKIQILSDLHNEFLRNEETVFDHLWNGSIPDTSADMIVLAGDIDIGMMGIEWARAESQRLSKPIIYVPGNHEYYHNEYFSLRNEMSQVSTESGVHCLDCGVIMINDVRFIGATLWTDYDAYTGLPKDQAMSAILNRLPDHRVIRYQSHDQVRIFMPQDAQSIHHKELSWIEQQLARDFDGQTVVVTHHGPHPLCQHPDYPLSEISPAFHSDLSKLLESYDIDLWIYGHTHSNLDVMVSKTRIVSNQAGYPGENVAGFCADFLITI